LNSKSGGEGPEGQQNDPQKEKDPIPIKKKRGEKKMRTSSPLKKSKVRLAEKDLRETKQISLERAKRREGN